MSPKPAEQKVLEDRAVYNMHDAKSNLSRLVDLAAAGREIIIARDGRPAARLVALESGRRRVVRKKPSCAGETDRALPEPS